MLKFAVPHWLRRFLLSELFEHAPRGELWRSWGQDLLTHFLSKSRGSLAYRSAAFRSRINRSKLRIVLLASEACIIIRKGRPAPSDHTPYGLNKQSQLV